MAQPLAEHLHRWLKGHREAIEFCLGVFRVCHLWDDLIDKDTPVSETQIHAAFWTALIDLPQNPFYVRHFATLHPVLMLGVLNWKSANRLEQSEVYDRQVVAFAIRTAISDVIAMSALLIAGPQWAEEVHYEMQLASPEPLADYLRSLPKTEEVR